jgi:N-methylhydantoinase B
LPLKTGAIVDLVSAGGGGRGKPVKRLVERVLEDVRQGYVTIEGARRDYIVVIDPKSLTVDATATAALRGNLQDPPRAAAE